MPHPDASPKRPIARRPVFWAWLTGGTVIACALVVVVLLTLTPPAARTALPSPAATDTVEAEQSPSVSTPSPPAPATPVPETVVIPTACEDIYTHDLTPEFDGLVLNPAWAEAPGSTGPNSYDEVVNDAVTEHTKLTCKWGSPNGGSGRGLLTNVAAVDDALRTDMLTRLAAVGHNCYDEREGVRCVIESAPSADGQHGESHFFRSGIWVATLWVSAGPNGYTNDIVSALFD